MHVNVSSPPYTGTEAYVLAMFLGIIIQCKQKTGRPTLGDVCVPCDTHPTLARLSLLYFQLQQSTANLNGWGLTKVYFQLSPNPTFPQSLMELPLKTSLHTEKNKLRLTEKPHQGYMKGQSKD